MKKNFVLCGIVGWCLEIFFTGFNSFRRREMKLQGTTSLWMFPIYGMASFIPLIYKTICKFNFFVRGIIYSVIIFFVEYNSGKFLDKYNYCPWNYKKSKYNYKGFIRIDYAPYWFLTGLLYEKIFCKK